LAWADGEAASEIQGRAPHAVVCRVQIQRPGGELHTGVVFDALAEADACRPLLEAIRDRRRPTGLDRGLGGSIESAEPIADATFEARVVKSEHGNGAIVFGDRYFLTLFRRTGAGTNPALEVGRALVRHGNPACTPPLLGAIEYLPR